MSADNFYAKFNENLSLIKTNLNKSVFSPLYNKDQVTDNAKNQF